MKKYIILALALLLPFNKVYANELIDMGYNYITEDSSYYYDKDNYIINYTDWQNYSGEELENIEVKTFYKYNKVVPIRYIHIYNGGIGTYKLKISELKILNGLEEINYEKECVYCSEDTIDYLNDNIYEFDRQYTMNFRNGYLIIDLLGEYELEDLNIKIYLNDETSLFKKYSIGFSTNKEKDNFVTTKYFEEDVYSYKQNVMYEYSVDDNWNINYNFVEEYESDKLIEDTIFYQKISECQKYRLYDFKYKTYMINKEDKEVDEKQEYNQPTKTVISTTNIEPMIQNTSVKTDNTQKNLETNSDSEKIKESTVKVTGNSTYKAINKYKTTNNKSYNNIFIIIYILIIINTLIMLFLLNRKKLSYEK